MDSISEGLKKYFVDRGEVVCQRLGHGALLLAKWVPERPLFLVRHGETNDGETITARGQKALRDAWSKISCDRFSNTQIHYLHAKEQKELSKRFSTTASIIEEVIYKKCRKKIALKEILVDKLEDDKDQRKVWRTVKMSKKSRRTQIFVLGHRWLTALAKKDASEHLPSFVGLWSSTKKLYDCNNKGNIGNARSFSYNYLFELCWDETECLDRCGMGIAIP